MPVCLPGSPPLRLLGNYDDRCSPSAAALLRRCKPLRPCLSSHVTMETKASPSAGLARKRRKKSVVFADSQGLALTAVHVFDELQFQLAELEGAAAALHLADTGEGAELVITDHTH